VPTTRATTTTAAQIPIVGPRTFDQVASEWRSDLTQLGNRYPLLTDVSELADASVDVEEARTDSEGHTWTVLTATEPAIQISVYQNTGDDHVSRIMVAALDGAVVPSDDDAVDPFMSAAQALIWTLMPIAEIDELEQLAGRTFERVGSDSRAW